MTVRTRVTVTFCAVLLAVFAASGAFVYLRMRASLDESVSNGLRATAGQVRALVGGGEGSLGSSGGVIEADETFAQIIAGDGHVVDSTPRQRAIAVVAPGTSGEQTLDRVPGLESSVRVLALDAGGRTIVVGASLGDRDEALGRLLRLLLASGLGGLALASAAGYWTVRRALSPVEAMRRRADEVTGAERLPVPEADDELRRLGLTLNEMLDRLQDVRERERRFVDDASHELRTPLALVRTELELALRQGRTVEDLRAALTASLADVDGLIGLAQGLLVLARAGETVARDEIDARALLDGVAERLPPGADVRVEVPTGLRLHGDRLLLERALANLADNAVRHGASPVTLAAGPGELRVRDAGGGFDPAFLTRAFDRFARGDTARTTPGSGLGLAIVAAIAAAHGGRVRAVNLPGGGAEVAFTIVSCDPRQDAGHDQQDEVDRRDLHGAGSGRRR